MGEEIKNVFIIQDVGSLGEIEKELKLKSYFTKEKAKELDLEFNDKHTCLCCFTDDDFENQLKEIFYKLVTENPFNQVRIIQM